MSTETAESAVQTESSAGRRTVVIPPARTAEALYAEFAAKLNFPGHFGHNLDALYDCLLDYALAVREPTTLIWCVNPQAADIDAEEVGGILEDVENYSSSGKGAAALFRVRTVHQEGPSAG